MPQAALSDLIRKLQSLVRHASNELQPNQTLSTSSPAEDRLETALQIVRALNVEHSYDFATDQRMVECLREMPVERRRDYVQRVFGNDFLRGLNEAPNGAGFARTITTTTTRRDGGATTTTTTGNNNCLPGSCSLTHRSSATTRAVICKSEHFRSQLENISEIERNMVILMERRELTVTYICSPSRINFGWEIFQTLRMEGNVAMRYGMNYFPLQHLRIDSFLKR